MLTSHPLWQSGGGGGGAFTAQVSDDDVSTYQFWNGIPPRPVIYAPYVTASALGGTGPFTYAWTEVDKSSLGWPYPSGQTISAAAAATTRWSDDDTSGPFSSTGWWKCTITDATAATAITPEVRVEIERST
jgi:hypothetical protein